MSEQEQTETATPIRYTDYRVRKGVIRMPRNKDTARVFVTQGDFLRVGDLIPEGVMDAAEIASLVESGTVVAAGLTEAAREQAGQAIEPRSKWSVAPAALVGKSMEDLLIMILEIDEDYPADEIEDEKSAVELLTSGWKTEFGEPSMPASSDKTTPALTSEGARDAGIVPPSSEAEAALQRARDAAQGDEPE